MQFKSGVIREDLQKDICSHDVFKLYMTAYLVFLIILISSPFHKNIVWTVILNFRLLRVSVKTFQG